MRALRNFRHNRCYHLVGRIVHLAFFLTDEERTRFVERLWRVAKKTVLSILLSAASCAAFAEELSLDDIARLEDAEQRISVRPGDPAKGIPFWNVRSQFYRRPPNFDFRPVAGAVSYEYMVVDANHARQTFTTNIPYATLAPVWAKVPAGAVTVFCEGKDEKGVACGRAGFKRFVKCANFTGDYPRPSRSRTEAMRMAYDYIANLTTNKTALYLSYPSKMSGAAIQAMVKYAERVPEARERALKIARAEADGLLATREKPGTPLEGFTLTYAAEPVKGETKEATRYRGQSMNVYPARTAEAILALYAATKDEKYLTAAKTVAETYLRRQLPNGTWYLKEGLKDGRPVNENLLVPNAVISFLLKLNRVTGDSRYLAAADRAFGYIEQHPHATWNWEGQFEDVEPSKPYRNLSIHMSCETALYILARYPDDPKRIAEAREILRFAEDQFVFWERPLQPWAKSLFTGRRYPAAFEQYACYTPIDSSAARAIDLYIAIYRAEKKPLDLLKARALADSIVAVQEPDGRIPTWWEDETVDSREADWINCMISAADALGLVAGEESR